MKNKVKFFSFFKGIKEYTQNHPFVKFLMVLLLFLSYLFFTMINFGISNGLMVTLLTWTFFVFGTPIADAGVLIDFPFRLITGIKMIYSEIFVWVIAISLNIYMLIFSSEIYAKTYLLTILKTILLNPFPFGLIILISLAGTFISVYFGDELLDALSNKKREKYKKHKNKHRVIIISFLITAIILVYYYMLKYLGIQF